MENRSRKLAPQYHRQDWRNKMICSTANYRYTREFVLRNYQNLVQPAFRNIEELSEIVLSTPDPPLLTAFFPFAHQLGDDPNSRKHLAREKKPEQIPEWYDEDEELKDSSGKTEEKNKVVEEAVDIKAGLAGNVKNFPQKGLDEKDIEENFTKVDIEVEEKLKKNQNEEDSEMPEWDEPSKEEFTFEPIKTLKPAFTPPVYDINLLRYHFAIGNPFAQTLIDFGVPYGKNGITFNPDSKPFEKIWYYKDLEGRIQGPFSTLEMFGWTIRDCFPHDLEISIGDSMYFVPMNIFNSMIQFPEPVYYHPKNEKTKPTQDESFKYSRTGNNNNYKINNKNEGKANDSATSEIKNMLGINRKK